MVVLGEGSLALEDVDGYGDLLILVGGEHLRLLGLDNSSSRDKLGHHLIHCLYSEVKVDDQDVLGGLRFLTSHDSSLNGGSVGNGLDWVDSSVWLFAEEEILDELLHLGDSS